MNTFNSLFSLKGVISVNYCQIVIFCTCADIGHRRSWNIYIENWGKVASNLPIMFWKYLKYLFLKIGAKWLPLSPNNIWKIFEIFISKIGAKGRLRSPNALSTYSIKPTLSCRETFAKVFTTINNSVNLMIDLCQWSFMLEYWILNSMKNMNLSKFLFSN